MHKCIYNHMYRYIFFTITQISKVSSLYRVKVTIWMQLKPSMCPLIILKQ